LAVARKRSKQPSEASRARGKLSAQKKDANTQAKYGRRGKPAPVIVKYMDGRETEIVDQVQIAGAPKKWKPKKKQVRRPKSKSMQRIDRISSALDHELSDALAKDSQWRAGTLKGNSYLAGDRQKLNQGRNEEMKYRTIVVDPPWHYDRFPRTEATGRDKRIAQGKFSHREMPYRSMSLDEIRMLPVADMALPDARLFLWTGWVFPMRKDGRPDQRYTRPSQACPECDGRGWEEGS
jgi:hypothetical protein